jgi:hypothetical protein
MSGARLQAGPHRPVPTTPPLSPQSARRTWSLDVTYPDGLDRDVVADIRGRDVRVDAGGAIDVRDELAARIHIAALGNEIVAVDASRTNMAMDALVGAEMRGGFGRRVAELFPEHGTRRSLCYSALEDLAGALLVSGYAHLHDGLIPQTREMTELAASIQSDICIGWAADGPVIATMREHGYNPVPIGPDAPGLGGTDADGWHDLPPLRAPTVRRMRRLDVLAPTEAGARRIGEHFRDSYASADRETVMHEYLVDAEVDPTGRVTSIVVDPRVLPWRECPGAASGAQRIVGSMLADLPKRIRRDLVGATTCTHLNSTLRTLADAHSLAQSI